MNSSRMRVKALVYIAIFAALIAVCAWIAVPYVVPFTMQTFGVFLVLFLLGGKYGTAAISVYLLLGAVGAPVFANFGGGLGTLLGATGGYIIGFLAMGVLYWACTRSGKCQSTWAQIAVMVVGQAVCYAFGTAWFVVVYTNAGKSIGFTAALMMCVVPYIIPDMVKLALAYALSKRLKPYVKLAA